MFTKTGIPQCDRLGVGEWTSAYGRCDRLGVGGRRPRCGRLWHARGEDARVAGVYGMRGGKTPALRAGLIGRGLDASALKGRQNTARGVAERNPGMTRARIEPTGRNRAICGAYCPIRGNSVARARIAAGNTGAPEPVLSDSEIGRQRARIER